MKRTWIHEQVHWGGICSGQREKHVQRPRGFRDLDAVKKPLVC